MKALKLFSVAYLWLTSCQLMAQPSLTAVFQLPDTVKPFTLDMFYTVVLDHHPVARQAALLSEMARQEIRLARGAFDPKLDFALSRKQFQGKTYYDQTDAQIYFPSQFPLNPKVGIERNRGTLLNPSETIPGERQLFAGISMPLVRGLFTDDRRADLQRAKLFQTLAEADQIKMVNKVLLQAAKEYWQWYHAYYNYRLLNRATAVASEIFSRVKMNQSYGEAAAIDTVQAKITLQTRLVEQQEALLAFQNAGITLSNFLWDDQGQPLQLAPHVAPVAAVQDGEILSLKTAEDLAVTARENHPDLRKIRTEIEQLRVDEALAKEFLKPRLDLDYAMLAEPSRNFSLDPVNDYKLGLDFSFPILLRKERSKLAQTRLKITGTQYEQILAEREIVNEVNATFNQLANTGIILGQQTEMVNLYDRILNAELLNLEQGESDLFKINIQLEKLIQAQSKLLKLQAEYEKLKAQLYWAAGVRNLGITD
jgi:outer membrane protein TolC